MSVEPRGLTTEELRARVLAAQSGDAESVTRGDLPSETYPVREPRPEGRTFYDPARPPLDSEGAERP